MEPRASEIGANGLRLRVWEWAGPGPATLLLHGIGNYGRYWDFVAEEVAGRLRLVAPDARGHGDSEKPASGYRRADYVADALGIADALRLERFLLAGHSMGGRHAVALAAEHPERVLGLAVIDAGPESLPEGRERAYRLTAGRPTRFVDEGAALAYLRETSPGYSDAVYQNRLRWVLRSDREGGLEWRSSHEALLQTMAQGSDPVALWAELEHVRCPAVVLRGTRSYSLGADTARSMVERMAQARLVEVDAAHNVPLERPRETAEAILALATESATA